jgi:hypothetical protein
MGWREILKSLPGDKEDKEDYVKPVLAPALEPGAHNPLYPSGRSLKAVDEAEAADISVWLHRVLNADTTDGVLAVVESFRLLDWTDNQRSQMSRYYIRKLSSISSLSTSTWTET